VAVRKFAQANNRIFEGDDQALDMTNKDNNSETKKEVLESQVPRMVKAHDILEILYCSPKQHATQKESYTQHKVMSVVGYIPYLEEMLEVSWSLFQHDVVAAFKLSARSPLPPALSAKDIPGGRTQLLSVPRISTINHHPVKSAEDSTPESNCHNEN